MATLIRMLGEVEYVVKEIYDRANEAECSRPEEYLAAVTIQAWFRGTRVRAYLKHLNKCATAIQRIWRGFLARRFYRILVKNTLFLMKLNLYNHMASRIQNVWRGYYVRKYVFNYYSRKRYLEALQVKSEIIRSELADYAEQQREIRKKEEEKNEKQRRDYEARKKHHLLSTEVIPGIYNSPFLPYPSEMEYLLRSLRPLSHNKLKKEQNEFDPVCTNYSAKVPTELPALFEKPQGPFRDPKEVQRQRYRPFEPSLRVCTDFYSLEEARKKLKEDEWASRLHDNILFPFIHRPVAYESLLHTSSKYGHLPYGSKHFREEFPEKRVCPVNFKGQVPPVPLFDKLNKTY